MPAEPRETRRPSRRGQPVVDRVLEVTLARLAEVGYARLSIPEVADLAGVHKTSVYRRWPTKEGLVREALLRSLHGGATAPDTGTLRGDMLEMVRRAATHAQSPAGMGAIRSVLADGVPGLDLATPGVLFGQGDGGVEQLLRRGMERGELRADADLALLVATVAGAMLHRLLVERLPADDAYLAALVSLVLDGAAAP